MKQNSANRHRRGKRDRITAPDVVQRENEITVDHIVGTLTRKRERYEQKWGVGRLPEIVSPKMAHKFGKAVERFERAMMADPLDVELIRAETENLSKGYDALDAAATAAGCEQVDESFLALTINEKPAYIAYDRAAVRNLQRLHPDAAIWTVEELERALSASGMALVNAAKAVFAESELVRVDDVAKAKSEKLIDDEIPF